MSVSLTPPIGAGITASSQLSLSSPLLNSSLSLTPDEDDYKRTSKDDSKRDDDSSSSSTSSAFSVHGIDSSYDDLYIKQDALRFTLHS